MKKPFYAAALLIGCSLVFACGGVKTEKTDATPPEEGPFSRLELRQQDSVWAEVMVLHDSIMPHSAEINELTQALKKELRENKSLDNDRRNQMITALEFLEQADASMFDWMHNLEQPENLRTSMTHPQILEYIRKQKDTIAKVGKDMSRSIEAGRMLMDE